MLIKESLIDEIELKAKSSSRLRANYCLHESQTDKVQKMINVLLPGTEIPVHRHLYTDETLVLMRGETQVVYYDDDGKEINRFHISHDDNYAIDIPKAQWHTIIVETPITLFETKEGPYRSLSAIELK